MLAYKFVIKYQQVEQRILTLANAVKQKKEFQKKQQQPAIFWESFQQYTTAGIMSVSFKRICW
eukprot:scaffold6934_cov100-Cylindrotheca_fusiformis.AAC.2